MENIKERELKINLTKKMIDDVNKKVLEYCEEEFRKLNTKTSCGSHSLLFSNSIFKDEKNEIVYSITVSSSIHNYTTNIKWNNAHANLLKIDEKSFDFYYQKLEKWYEKMKNIEFETLN